MPGLPDCFKAYDIRGRVPQEINEDLSYCLGLALADRYDPRKVVLGHDVRLSSPALHNALASALQSRDITVCSLGQCGTEEIYYAAARVDVDLGVMVTGSHNSIDENGFKIVTAGAVPVSSDSGLRELAASTGAYMEVSLPRQYIAEKMESLNLREEWLEWMLKYAGLDRPASRRLKVVIDAGNGSAGPVLEALESRLPIELVPLNFDPDGSFPHGVPNPMLAEGRREVALAVLRHRADLGVAFDSDFDRCFFFNHRGEFVETCYLAGLLASHLLMKHPGEKIIHDLRIYWNTRDLIYTGGGIPQVSRGGHSFMKETLRREQALYGVEMSGRHFYRDFAYSDSGMLTMLLVIALVLRSDQSLAELVEAGESAYPCSGEVNFKVDDADRVLEAVWKKYRRDAIYMDHVDGINLEYPGWRFNLRKSSTEPLLRLNLESRGDPELVRKKLKQLAGFIRNA